MTHEMFACARPQGARPTGEKEERAGATFSIWRTETREYLRIERGRDETWFRMEVTNEIA